MLIAYWLLLVFVLGAVVGSFLNVVVARLPKEKSLLWPGSRCGSCFQRVRWYDNIPLFSYLWLGGRCRVCDTKFSSQYFFVELLTALGFLGIFYLEVMENIHNWPRGIVEHHFHSYSYEPELVIPQHFWVGYLWHCTLFSLLMAAAVCDLQSREIPIQLTLGGTFIGLVGSAFLPWPYPRMPFEVQTMQQNFGFERPMGFGFLGQTLAEGVYPWPVWLPTHEWLPIGSWQLGLATGITGALVGTFMLRTIGFLFSAGLGKEALGLGDADLMMMVGAFLGWQIVVVAFFISVVPALFLGLLQLAIHRDNSLPFGPSLGMGAMTALLGWKWVGPYVQPLFFAPILIGVLTGAACIFILCASFFMSLFRGEKA